MADLYRQIISCDTVLEQLENLLNNFQKDIKNVGGEIKKLQEDCMKHQVKLNNRSNVETMLERFVSQIHIPMEMQDFLLNGDVNEMYQEYLIEFNRKVSFIETQKAVEGDDHLMAVQDLEPVIRAMQDRAVAKTRAFLIAQFSSRFRDTNDVKANHRELLKFSYIYQYLFKNDPGNTRDTSILMRKN